MSDLKLMSSASYARQIVERDVASLKPYARNARTHSKKQLKQIAASIERFGFVNPVLIGDDDTIIAGHGRVEAAKLLGHKSVPTLALSYLSKTERCAYILPTTNSHSMRAGIMSFWRSSSRVCSTKTSTLISPVLI